MKTTTKPKHGRFNDLEGRKFSRWAVVGYAGRKLTGKQMKTFWWCRCSCGTTRQVEAQSLSSDGSKSCGCYEREVAGEHRRVHGGTGTVEYTTWKRLRSRCNNPKSPDWNNYGGRGIRVCAEWDAIETGFSKFLLDMGPRPGDYYSVERKDNDGPYSAENCVWATNYEQSRNRRTNHMFTWEGETLCLKDWANRFNIKYDKLRRRLLKYGWPFYRAITTA